MHDLYRIEYAACRGCCPFFRVAGLRLPRNPESPAPSATEELDPANRNRYDVNDIRKNEKERNMSQITARLPDEVVLALDHAARTLNRSRADVVRQAIESYLEDFDDLNAAIERLRDPADETIDWQEARRVLLAQD
ncbi:ribbon-helix-helix protein, CopG family [Desulfobulbus alkaliphilus]|uniref:ribbon-helix-helix protein, CopG family n=1 Tax=Desulfobulbus alkaliphilus TaxID=869814 RepID=UPI00196241E8|nr:ribbon-helix-helix protein, CopG family [Desulfobulbus alkaliphilus]MBM9538430.1 ribbon-helix-helix protein, CopG family [Desulfobulbus alkaliphilus]